PFSSAAIVRLFPHCGQKLARSAAICPHERHAVASGRATVGPDCGVNCDSGWAIYDVRGVIRLIKGVSTASNKAAASVIRATLPKALNRTCGKPSGLSVLNSWLVRPAM